MGATNFTARANGKTAAAAFVAAVKRDKEMVAIESEAGDPDDPYLGTVSQCKGFIEVRPAELVDTRQPFDEYDLADAILADSRFEKWGNCAAIQTHADRYVFIGWAAE